MNFCRLSTWTPANGGHTYCNHMQRHTKPKSMKSIYIYIYILWNAHTILITHKTNQKWKVKTRIRPKYNDIECHITPCPCTRRCPGERGFIVQTKLTKVKTRRSDCRRELIRRRRWSGDDGDKRCAFDWPIHLAPVYTFIILAGHWLSSTLPRDRIVLYSQIYRWWQFAIVGRVRVIVIRTLQHVVYGYRALLIRTQSAIQELYNIYEFTYFDIADNTNQLSNFIGNYCLNLFQRQTENQNTKFYNNTVF